MSESLRNRDRSTRTSGLRRPPRRAGRRAPGRSRRVAISAATRRAPHGEDVGLERPQPPDRSPHRASRPARRIGPTPSHGRSIAPTLESNAIRRDLSQVSKRMPGHSSIVAGRVDDRHRDRALAPPPSRDKRRRPSPDGSPARSSPRLPYARGDPAIDRASRVRHPPARPCGRSIPLQILGGDPSAAVGPIQSSARRARR